MWAENGLWIQKMQNKHREVRNLKNPFYGWLTLIIALRKMAAQYCRRKPIMHQRRL